MDDSQKIVEKEIERLERYYRDAQDRYAYTGSPSTDRTMYKYSVLKDALIKSQAGPNDEEMRLMRRIDDIRQNVFNAQQYINNLERDGDLMPGYAGTLKRILEGRR